MRSMLSGLLALIPFFSSGPLQAQDFQDMGSFVSLPSTPRAAPRRLSDAAMRETQQLAAAEPPAGSAIEPQDIKRTERSWSRVRALNPGAEITVTPKGSAPVARYIVSADESGLVVLNFYGVTEPDATRKVIANLVSAHMAALNEGQRFADRNVRVGMDGVFVEDRKVAELDRLVERLTRAEVLEIEGPIRTGSIAGGVVLGLTGLVIGFGAAWGATSRDEARTIFFGLPVLGAFAGYRLFGHTRQGVIYRAP